MVFGSDAPQGPGQHIFKPEQLVECHTPLKTLLPAFHDKFVLVAGYKETIEAIHDYGFKKAIHSEELLGLIPEIAPLPTRTMPESLLTARKEAVLKRFGMTREELLEQLKFDALFIACDVYNYEFNMEIFTELVLSKDGRLGQKDRRMSMAEKQHCKMFITNPDLKWADKYILPRMSGQLPFVLALNSYLDAAFDGMKAEYTTFGKPSKLTFEYAEEVLREQAAELGVDLTEIYMIGDNPPGDIKGPN